MQATLCQSITGALACAPFKPSTTQCVIGSCQSITGALACAPCQPCLGLPVVTTCQSITGARACAPAEKEGSRMTKDRCQSITGALACAPRSVQATRQGCLRVSRSPARWPARRSISVSAVDSPSVSVDHRRAGLRAISYQTFRSQARGVSRSPARWPARLPRPLPLISLRVAQASTSATPNTELNYKAGSHSARLKSFKEPELWQTRVPPDPSVTIFALARSAPGCQIRFSSRLGTSNLIDRRASVPPPQVALRGIGEGANADPRQHFLTLTRDDCVATRMPIARRRDGC